MNYYSINFHSVFQLISELLVKCMFNVMDVKAPFLCVKQTYSGQLNCAVPFLKDKRHIYKRICLKGEDNFAIISISIHQFTYLSVVS